MSKIEIQDIPVVPVLFQSMTIGHDKIGEACSVILPAVGAFMNEHGLASAGPPFARYTAWRETDCDMDAGFPITALVETYGTVTFGTRGGCQTAVAIHEGPYDTLRETYDLLFAWIREQGRMISGPTWEVYFTDPGKLPDPGDWKTEIYVPIG